MGVNVWDVELAWKQSDEVRARDEIVTGALPVEGPRAGEECSYKEVGRHVGTRRWGGLTCQAGWEASSDRERNVVSRRWGGRL